MFLVSSASHHSNCWGIFVEIPGRKIAGTLCLLSSQILLRDSANASFSQQVERQHAPRSAALLSEGTDFPRRSHEISLLLKYSPHTFIKTFHTVWHH